MFKKEYFLKNSENFRTSKKFRKVQKNSKDFRKIRNNSKIENSKNFSVTTPITSTVQIARVIWITRRVMSVASYSACPVTIKWAFPFAPRVAAQSKDAA